MKSSGFAVLALVAAATASAQTPDAPSQAELARWRSEAAAVTIVRDDWGIAHVRGHTDAEAVFGMEYAQAEDDFNRVETSYLNSLGRLAEAEGEKAVIQDLRQRLFMDPEDLKQKYAQSPKWLQSLMDAFADGLNFYLHTHPEVHPRAIGRFEPWMALSFTEGSSGGDIAGVKLDPLEKFYAKPAGTVAAGGERAGLPGGDDNSPEIPALTGSNGMAIAPSNTANGHALLLINPHTEFFFRSELQMTSDEGLNAYGAVTWGQFFVYQGFNDRVGWMHPTSSVNAVNEYLETVSSNGGAWHYKFGAEERPVRTRTITVAYKTAGGMARRSFTAYFTQHGPIIRSETRDGAERWVAIRLMQKPIEALEQSYLRTKARDYKTYWKTMELYANSSNNTVFASVDGDIALFDGNYIPRRDARFDWTKPVDGSDPATEYQGFFTVEESPHLLNPRSGWLYNCNNSVWSAAGPDSPKKEDYPVYVDQGYDAARALHAIRVLSARKDFTLDSLIAAAYDSYLPWFENTIPALVRAWDATPDSDGLKAALAPQIEVLRKWNLRWAADSVATSLAIFWGEEIRRTALLAKPGVKEVALEDHISRDMAPADLLKALDAASRKLSGDFGSWRTRWGDINRFQRINDDIVQTFDDNGPSIPVPFTSVMWGSLASYEAKAWPGAKKRYAAMGNSFVAVVEFAPRIRARAITVGGESGHPGSKHFGDQARLYPGGDLREVYFYPDQLPGHTERQYHPGD